MELRKNLGLIHVFCIATGAMVSSGIFILPGLAYAKVGPAVILCYFLAGLLSVPGMLSLAEMTTAMPKAGGDCFTIIRSMGPSVGTVAGLLSWFSLSMKSAFALVGMSIFTVLLFDINIHILAVFFCMVFLFINLIGIKEAGTTQVFMVTGLFLLMMLYIFMGLPEVKVHNFSPFVPKGIASVFFTTGFVFVSYTGLLKIASVAEEIKNPSRTIPLGMVLSIVVVILLYAFMVFVTTGVLEADKLSRSLTPISDGAEVFMGTGGKIALSIAAILAFLSTANAGIMTAAGVLRQNQFEIRNTSQCFNSNRIIYYPFFVPETRNPGGGGLCSSDTHKPAFVRFRNYSEGKPDSQLPATFPCAIIPLVADIRDSRIRLCDIRNGLRSSFDKLSAHCSCRLHILVLRPYQGEQRVCLASPY